MASPTNFVINAENEMKQIMNLIYEAENRAGDLLRKYQRLGSNSFTNQHFFIDDPDNPGTQIDKPGLNYTKDEFSTAVGNLEQLSKISEIVPSDNVFISSLFETYVKITG
jgi:hypothetical protein